MPELICEIWHDEASFSFEAGQVSYEHDLSRKSVSPNAILVHTYIARSDFEVFQKSNDWHEWEPWHPPEGIPERFFTEDEAEEQRRYIAVRETTFAKSAVTDLFAPGDVYEDVFYHPCLALGVSYEADEIWGISLIDGSYPRCMSLAQNDIRKISLNGVWELKQRHIRHNGRDGWWVTDQSE